MRAAPVPAARPLRPFVLKAFDHGLIVSRETLRKWMAEAGIWLSRKHRRGDVRLTEVEVVSWSADMIQSTTSYKRHRFPPAVIAHAVWLYFRFPLSLRLVEEMLLERGIVVTYETIRCWAKKFGPDYAGRLRRKQPSPIDIWHLDEVVVTIGGKKHWQWRAVDQDGYVLDEIVQARRDTKAARRLLIRLLRKQGCGPKRIVTDKLRSYAAARRQVMPTVASINRTRG